MGPNRTYSAQPTLASVWLIRLHRDEPVTTHSSDLTLISAVHPAIAPHLVTPFRAPAKHAGHLRKCGRNLRPRERSTRVSPSTHIERFASSGVELKQEIQIFLVEQPKHDEVVESTKGYQFDIPANTA